MGSDLLHGDPSRWETFGQDEKEKENTMSDEKESDHNYDPEKIRDAIQDHLYRGLDPLGDVEPPENAEEIEDGIRVGELSLPSCCRIFFRVMGSWFSLDVDRERIENDPTIAEDVVAEGTARTVHGDEVEKIAFSGTTTIIFKDGSKVVCRDCSWEVL